MTTQPSIGQPLDRVDGRLKVTGAATYAHEFRPDRAPAHGFILPAAIAKGRVAEIDTRLAELAPGVLLVMTHRNAPRQAEFGSARDPQGVPNRFARARPFLGDDRVRFWGEPVAFVVAHSFEAARHAASLIRVTYAAEPQATDLRANLDKAYAPPTINVGMATDTASGDFEAAFASAAVTVDSRYWVGYQAHNALEPHAALAEWDGSRLTIHTATQTLANTRTAVAATLRMSVEDVRIVSPFIGGGFGGKLGVRAETILAAMAARELRRPVKAAQTRQQVFHNVGHRPASVQHVKLAAARDGRLTGISHDVYMQTSVMEEFAEQTATATRSLYAAPNRSTRHRLVPLDMQGGEPVRAPGEAPGLLALETAMDELAGALGLDPVELRVLNEPDRDPERQVPFSSRNLVRCLREGARRFRWSERPTMPGERRDGRWLIGYGMSAAIRPNYLGRCEASATLDREGTVTVRTDMTDIGTGTYTILTQIAADELGLPPDEIRVQLGDTRFPRSPGSGGSWGAASSGSAVKDACAKLRAALADRARLALSAPFLDLARAVAGEEVTARGEIGGMGESYRQFSQHGFGAHFAEVGVDADTGEIRLRRMLGVFAVGRVLNPKTARSQMLGGMIWGVSSALHEDAIVDPRFGQFVNHDLAEYHLPVHADVPNVEAFFVEEEDDKGNPLGIKGIGELGICGAGASVGNAVYNATGVRVRDFPITLDKVLEGLSRSAT
ncbi:molybdopterin cofactor-binding domain-containing protein [Methylobacterium oryzisoli]|uniref:molybdopterin cofactor-binding domain-containing protein n=1 Tax=Methylobacterium oryzisoli TaxID=3385502 RepID=UPI003891F6C1